MPAGIEAVVEDGFTTLDFVDRSLVGPALETLRLAGSKVSKVTRVGPRTQYRLTEADAVAAGLLDAATVRPEALAYGDTGYAEDLESVGNAGARPHRPTVRGNAYVGKTPAADVMAVPGPSTTVNGSVPDDRVVPPLHEEVIDTVGETTIHSPQPQRPPAAGDGGSSTPPPVVPAPLPAVDPVSHATTQPAPAGGTPNEDWTNAEIKAYADANGIDLDGATKKSDMLAAIELAS
jgi:hypothetical protein